MQVSLEKRSLNGCSAVIVVYVIHVFLKYMRLLLNNCIILLLIEAQLLQSSVMFCFVDQMTVTGLRLIN